MLREDVKEVSCLNLVLTRLLLMLSHFVARSRTLREDVKEVSCLNLVLNPATTDVVILLSPAGFEFQALSVYAGLKLRGCYSHSTVAGGLDVISYTTLFTPCTSFVILFDTLSNISYGILAQSAVIKSSVVTALIATTYSYVL